MFGSFSLAQSPCRVHRLEMSLPVCACTRHARCSLQSTCSHLCARASSEASCARRRRRFPTWPRRMEHPSPSPDACVALAFCASATLSERSGGGGSSPVIPRADCGLSRAHWFKEPSVTSPRRGGRAADHLERTPAIVANGSHGANAVAFHGAVRSLALITPLSHPPSPPFFLLFFGGCDRCFSVGSGFRGEFSAVSPFNYVHFCCLLLHAVSGPLRVSHLLRDMARKYIRIPIIPL